jgi:integrase
MGKRRGHGEGSIHLRPDGRWCAIVDLGRDANGRRKRKYVYGKTRKEVADQLKALHRDVAAGINLTPEQTTVEQFLHRWLDEIIIHRRPRTQESYRNTVRLHIVPYVGHHKLQKLSVEHVQAMVNKLTKSGLGARSVEYAALVLSRGLNQAKRWGYLQKNVVDGVELPRVKTHMVRPADEQQARALLDAVKGHRQEALYWIVLFLGLRRGEVLGLRITDLDFDTMTITIDGALQRQNGKLERSDPKTEGSRRILPMPAALAKVLREHLRRLDVERQQAGDAWQEHGYLFPTRVGTPSEPRNVVRNFKATLAAAGLPVTTRFHDLRHWCASLLIAFGTHPKAIQEILGHANIQITLDVYGHLLPNVLRDATDQMDALAPPEEAGEDSKEEPEKEE